MLTLHAHIVWGRLCPVMKERFGLEGTPEVDPLLLLRWKLRQLRRADGDVSYRQISRRTGKAISHSTVGVVLRCMETPSWGPLEQVVEALGGDSAEFKELWMAAREADDRRRSALPLFGDATSESRAVRMHSEPLDDVATRVGSPSETRVGSPSEEPVTSSGDVGGVLDTIPLVAGPSLEGILRRWLADPDREKAGFAREALEYRAAGRARVAGVLYRPLEDRRHPAWKHSRADYVLLLLAELTDVLVSDPDVAAYTVTRDRVITSWSPGAEKLSGHLKLDVVGRRCPDGVLSHVDECGRELCYAKCPLRSSILDGRCHQESAYMRHKGGYRWPVEVWTCPAYNRDGDEIGAVQVFSDAARPFHVEEPELVDELTGIGNRRYLESHLVPRFQEWSYQASSWSQFGVLLAEADLLQRFHEASDAEVRDRTHVVVAKTLACGLRGCDVVARYDTSRFAILLTGSGPADVEQVAERLRGLVASSRVPTAGHPIDVTISLGGTTVLSGDSAASLLGRAESQLVAAKEAGGNHGRVDRPRHQLAIRRNHPHRRRGDRARHAAPEV